MKDRLQPDESRRQCEKIRELNALAEKLGCTLTQLATAWCLKNESVQCLLLGASSVDQLYDSIQSLQVNNFLLLICRVGTSKGVERITDKGKNSSSLSWPKTTIIGCPVIIML